MAFVTYRCYGFDTEPSGGSLEPRLFKAERMGGEKIPEKGSNRYRAIVSDAVWHLVDIASGTGPHDSFSRALEEARMKGEGEDAEAMVQWIKGTDDGSIVNVCRLCMYECGGLITGRAMNPGTAMIQQIREMAESGGRFLEKHGPKTASGFSFGQGYADDLASDPWVFTTEDTLWLLDTSPSLKEKTTLSVLVHYLLGRRYAPEIRAVKKLGVYNPRLDTAYTMPVSDVPREVMASVESEYVEAALSYQRPARPESPSTTIVKAIGKIVLWLILIGIGFLGVLIILACLQ